MSLFEPAPEAPRRNRRWIILVASALIVVLGAVAGWIYWTRSPRYALKRASDAYREHDLETFEQYVDVERFSRSLVDFAMGQIVAESSKEDFGGLAAGFAMMMKPQMEKAAEDGLRKAVESGDPGSDEKDPAGLSDLSRYATPSEKEDVSGSRGLRGIEKNGKVAVAKLALYDASLRHEFIVELKMRDAGDHWQIFEVANLPKITEELKRVHQQRLEELNKPIRDAMKSAISLSNPRVRVSSGSWGMDLQVTFYIDAQNKSREAIESAFVIIHLERPDGSRDGSILAGAFGIQPGAKFTFYEQKELNPFIPSEKRIFDNAYGYALVPEFYSVKFLGGRELKLHETLPDSSANKNAKSPES